MTLNVEKQKAVEVYNASSEAEKRMLEKIFGEDVFIPSVMERIKTVEDVLNDNGLTVQQFEKMNKGLDPDEVAYRTIKLLNKSLNGNWKPNWYDENERKYLPWFEISGSSGFRYDDCVWQAYSAVGSRLCFKSVELARYAGQQFTEVYKQFMVID